MRIYDEHTAAGQTHGLRFKLLCIKPTETLNISNYYARTNSFARSLIHTYIFVWLAWRDQIAFHHTVPRASQSPLHQCVLYHSGNNLPATPPSSTPPPPPRSKNISIFSGTFVNLRSIQSFALAPTRSRAPAHDPWRCVHDVGGEYCWYVLAHILKPASHPPHTRQPPPFTSQRGERASAKIYPHERHRAGSAAAMAICMRYGTLRHTLVVTTFNIHTHTQKNTHAGRRGPPFAMLPPATTPSRYVALPCHAPTQSRTQSANGPCLSRCAPASPTTPLPPSRTTHVATSLRAGVHTRDDILCENYALRGEGKRAHCATARRTMRDWWSANVHIGRARLFSPSSSL